MAKVNVNVVVGMQKLDNIPMITEEIPAKTMDEMLRAEADVVEPEILKNANTMLKGQYWTGETGRALTRKKPVFTAGRNGDRQRQMVLTFTGTREDRYHKADTKSDTKTKGANRRNAAIAFINEYGTRNTPARPFVSQAVTKKEEEAMDAAEAIFDKWIEKNV